MYNTKNGSYSILLLIQFKKWRFDYVRRVHPRFSQGKAYIILAIDYLTKWMESKSVEFANKKITVFCIFENIFARYGVLRTLVDDRGMYFLNVLFKKLISKYGEPRGSWD